MDGTRTSPTGGCSKGATSCRHGDEGAHYCALGERRRSDSLIRSAADIGTATMKLGRPSIRRNSQLESRCGAPLARGDLHPAAQVELFQDVVDVALHGVGREADLLRDLLVAQALADQIRDLPFPCGQPHVADVDSATSACVFDDL